ANGIITAGSAEQTVAYGESATAPEITANENWTFTGWDVAFESVTSDLIITAQYEYVGSGTMFSYDINAGYNWISFPVLPEDGSVPSVMSDMVDKFIANFDKLTDSKGKIAQYYEGNWYGTLTSLEAGKKYVLNAAYAGSFNVLGAPVQADLAIDLEAGYNWIGLTVSEPMTVEEAMAGASPEDFDKFTNPAGKIAQYYAGSWYGTLTSLEPGVGYSYYCAEPQTIYFVGL
ncbi:MAG: hypothetical protein AB7F23_03750, partial [Phycisphaerae bacterium]